MTTRLLAALLLAACRCAAPPPAPEPPVRAAVLADGVEILLATDPGWSSPGAVEADAHEIHAAVAGVLDADLAAFRAALAGWVAYLVEPADLPCAPGAVGCTDWAARRVYVARRGGRCLRETAYPHELWHAVGHVPEPDAATSAAIYAAVGPCPP
jgi:hypothetical protein